MRTVTGYMGFFPSLVGWNISPAGFLPFSGGLEHQPSPRGWAESSPFLLRAGTSACAAGLSPVLFQAGKNISPAHAAGLSPALWLGQYRPSPAQSISFYFFSPFFCFFCVFFIIYIFEIVIFPPIFLRHFD